MVLGVCRRTLGDPHAADDAFQATFLVLARKAGSLGRPDALAGWLHGVARRVALKARSRRPDPGTTDGEAATPERGRDPLAELTGRELLAILEEELQRLPATYRLPVALCCLEGVGQDEAARRLGCTSGALRGRLERGRASLRARLAKRGVLPAAAVAVFGLTQITSAALPAGVAGLTARTALQFSNRTPAPEVVPARAAVLAEGVLSAMTRTKLQVAAVGLFAVALAVTGPVLIADPMANADPLPRPAPTRSGGPAPAAKPKELLALEKKLVGKWIGRGMFASVFTYRADGTFAGGIAGGAEASEGTWEMQWNALPPTLVIRPNRPDAPAGPFITWKVAALTDENLSLGEWEAVGTRMIHFRKVKDESPAGPGNGRPARDVGPAAREQPGRTDLVGEWRSHNGLAGVFFTLELKDDGAFVLSHREVAPKLDLMIAGKWSFDGDRITLQEERLLVDGKRIDVAAGLFFPRGRTDTLTVAAKEGRWVVTHGRGIEFIRYAAPKGETPKR